MFLSKNDYNNIMDSIAKLSIKLDGITQKSTATRVTIADKILALMNDGNGRSIDKVLAELELRKSQRSSVNATLSKLKMDGRLISCGWGIYQKPIAWRKGIMS